MSTFGDVEASVIRCTCLNRDGLACGKPCVPRLPLGVCLQHAIEITRAVLRLGPDLTTIAKEAA